MKRILVAMSGGVDSSVAAALLKTQGYDVVGVHMQLWDESAAPPPRKAGGHCATMVNPAYVKQICKELEIPLYIVDAKDQFQNDVIDYMVHEALQARLPNPCAMCNTKLKFSNLIKKADELKCEFVATGHYAKVVRNPDGTETNLYRAVDKTQDQTYFLFGLQQNQLSRAIMPLGDLLKANVLKMAQTFNISIPESSGSGKNEICFIADNSYRKYVKDRTPERYRPPGQIIDQEGRILGRHSGLFQYPIGRKMTEEVEKAPHIQCVTGYDLKSGSLIIGPETDLKKTGLVATGCNWIGMQDFSKGLKISAKIRPSHKEASCFVSLLNNNSVLVDFDEKQSAITAGQAIVFYQDDLVVGGGWIEALTEPITTKMAMKAAPVTTNP